MGKLRVLASSMRVWVCGAARRRALPEITKCTKTPRENEQDNRVLIASANKNFNSTMCINVDIQTMFNLKIVAQILMVRLRMVAE